MPAEILSASRQSLFAFTVDLHKRQIFVRVYPGADSRGERQIKEAKSVRAKVYKTGGRAPGRLPLTD